MNDKTQNALAQLIEKFNNGVDSAVAFSQQQIPDVIHQLLVFKTTQFAFLEVLFFILFVLCAGSIWYTIDSISKKRKWCIDCFNEVSPVVVLPFMLGGVGSLISICCFVTNTIDLLKITLAPKLYLLEYASSLIH